jgi:hypothetical protein|tara:strand:- start:1036 stop:2253 length:1218 start_codon:yes stop_codon:yes gene_type:complete
VTITGFSPHKKQQELLHSIINGKEKYHIASIGRQFGKSMMGMNLALYWGFNEAPCKILWVSPVYQQANKVQKELMGAIGGSGIVRSNNYSTNELELKNGSVIYFRSAERYDNIRGMTLDYSIIDEAAFIKDDAWAEAIKPTTIVRGKKVLFISTPKGKNWFYDLFQYGKSEDYPNYKSYTGSSYDTPFIDIEEIEDAKRTVPELVFKQEYLAEFIDGGGEVFTNLDLCTFEKYPNANGKVFAGLDIGKQADYTVLTLMDAKGRVLEIYRDNKNQWSVMIKEVLERVRKWNASLLVEVNGVGDPIYEQLKSQYANTHPFITTNKSKGEIIEGLILDFNEVNVHIPSKNLFSHLYNELSYFTYEYSPKTRSIKYGHPTGLHDDTVMSLAIANYNRKKNKTYGTYAVR